MIPSMFTDSQSIVLMISIPPLRAAVIGLGTGMTAKAVAAFPLEHIDVLEIEPAMGRVALRAHDSVHGLGGLEVIASA